VRNAHGSGVHPKRSFDADSRRRQIVGAAADLFDDLGYHQTSMTALAEEVGISKATLYHYFESKTTILYSIHEEFIDLLVDRHEGRTQITSEPAEVLRGIMTDILELMHSHRGHIRVFFEHWRELPESERRLVESKRNGYFETVLDQVNLGRAQGEFDTPSPALTTLAIFGMCNWAYQWYRPSGAITPDVIAGHFWSLFMHGVASPAPSARWIVMEQMP
jgi:TetR/AcrR family transcriptional regulator, cholesterol catabolism regulator